MADLTIPTLEEMRDQLLADIELAAIDSGVDDPPVGEGSDWYARATGLANLSTIPCQLVSTVEHEQSPAQCSDARIEQWRIDLGLPEVAAQGARGKVLVRLDAATGSVSDGTVLTRNGYQYQVVGPWVGLVDGQEIEVLGTDTGSVTNAAAKERLYWVSAPPGFQSWVEVSANEPLTGGIEDETPERKRERVIERMANPAVSGNWAAVREAIEAVLPTVRAYVYPALGGPSSSKVVLTKMIDPDNRDFSRAPTSSQLTLARQTLWADVADGTKHVVQGAALETTSVALSVEIPDATSSGGSGGGWLNDVPWPGLVSGDGGRVAVTAVTNSKVFTVGAQTTVAPVSGQSYVAWWSPGDQAFHRGLIVSYSGSTGAWVLTVNEPFVDDDNVPIAIGDFISPVATNIEAYGVTWRDLMAALGPGENTTDVYRLPRSERHPAVDAEDSPTLSTAQRKSFMMAHPEVVDCEYGYRSTSTATIPSSVSVAPNVLTLDNFGVYAAI